MIPVAHESLKSVSGQGHRVNPDMDQHLMTGIRPESDGMLCGKHKGHLSIRRGLQDVYKRQEHGQMDRLKEDVKEKFEKAKETFPSGAEGSAEPENAESLQLFGFICELAFDVFLKKQMIERLADELRAENPPKKKK